MNHKIDSDDSQKSSISVQMYNVYNAYPAKSFQILCFTQKTIITGSVQDNIQSSLIDVLA